MVSQDSKFANLLHISEVLLNLELNPTNMKKMTAFSFSYMWPQCIRVPGLMQNCLQQRLIHGSDCQDQAVFHFVLLRRHPFSILLQITRTVYYFWITVNRNIHLSRFYGFVRKLTGHRPSELYVTDFLVNHDSSSFSVV